MKLRSTVYAYIFSLYAQQAGVHTSVY